jgi:hypothetical protein
MKIATTTISHIKQVLSSSHNIHGHATAKAVNQGFPLPWPGYMEFAVNDVALGQILSKYFGFPCYFSFHQLLHIH